MALEWVDVADSAVKIGQGALITIVGGWITLKLTHLHEIWLLHWWMGSCHATDSIQLIEM